MSVLQLWFNGACDVECREGDLAPLQAGEVLVRTRYSAISAGTELLVYRGKIPEDMALDATLDSIKGTSQYPLQYGYACVGEVEKLGPGVDPSWLRRRVFSFQPHASAFTTLTTNLHLIPDDIPDEAAVFFPNMETAVNLVQDGAPMIGETVVVLGQGIVGLLLTAVLSEHPLAHLLTLDTLAYRRALSLEMGATASEDVADNPNALKARYFSAYKTAAGADLIFEVSGVPDALNTAIALSGYDSRIVIGSWYGTRSAAIVLGGDAHRNRLRITTSQVSTLASQLGGRWDKSRRSQTVWDMIRRVQPQRLISDRVSVKDAAQIYRRLHLAQQSSDQINQVIFTYNEGN